MWSKESKFQTRGLLCLPSPRFISCHLLSVSPPRAATTTSEQPKTGRQHVGQLPPSWGNWWQTSIGGICMKHSKLNRTKLWHFRGRILKSCHFISNHLSSLLSPPHWEKCVLFCCALVTMGSTWTFYEFSLKIGLFLEVMQACILGVNMHKLFTR